MNAERASVFRILRKTWNGSTGAANPRLRQRSGMTLEQGDAETLGWCKVELGVRPFG